MSRFKIVDCYQWLSGIEKDGIKAEAYSYIYYKIVEYQRGKMFPVEFYYRRPIEPKYRRFAGQLVRALQSELTNPHCQACYEPVFRLEAPKFLMRTIKYSVPWAELPNNLKRAHLKNAHPKLKYTDYVVKHGMSIQNGRTTWLERQKRERPDPENLKENVIEELARSLKHWSSISFGYQAPTAQSFGWAVGPWEPGNTSEIITVFPNHLDFLKKHLPINGGMSRYAYGAIDNRFIYAVDFFSSPSGHARGSRLARLIDVVEGKVLC